MNNILNDLEFTSAVNSLAVAMSSNFKSAAELAVAATIFTQIGDTLALIAARRVLCEEIQNDSSST